MYCFQEGNQIFVLIIREILDSVKEMDVKKMENERFSLEEWWTSRSFAFIEINTRRHSDYEKYLDIRWLYVVLNWGRVTLTRTLHYFRFHENGSHVYSLFIPFIPSLTPTHNKRFRGIGTVCSMCEFTLVKKVQGIRLPHYLRDMLSSIVRFWADSCAYSVK